MPIFKVMKGGKIFRVCIWMLLLVAPLSVYASKRKFRCAHLGVALVAETGISQRPLQRGGHTLLPRTATMLNKYFKKNLHPREWGAALERVKRGSTGNDDHGSIMPNGDYIDVQGNYLGNLAEDLN